MVIVILMVVFSDMDCDGVFTKEVLVFSFLPSCLVLPCENVTKLIY